MSENRVENPPILFSSPQSLLEITSFKLALICWYKEFRNIEMYSDLSIRVPDFNVNDVLRVTLPRHIPAMINRHIKLITSQLISWIDFHKSIIFHTRRIKVILQCLECIVFRSDGKLWYQITATNLLMNDRLNLDEKYRISCIYCFKETIDLLWPKVMDTVSISDSTIHGQYIDHFQTDLPFMAVNYWSGVKRNEYVVGPDLLRCIDMYLPAKVEFYWSTRNFSESSNLQFVADICRLNRNVINYDVMKFLISKLNVIQQKHLLTLIPLEIVLTLALEDVASCNFSLQAWKLVKDFFTNDDFFTLLRSLWQAAFGLSSKCGYVAVILREIWITAPNHLRDYILTNHAAVFFDQLKVPRDMRTFGVNLGFYIDLLSNLNPDLKYKFWFENWHKFICLTPVPNLVKLMKLCLVNENAIVSFKTDFMSNYTTLKSKLLLFIEASLYEELSTYLKFSCSDTTQRQEIQQQLLSLFLNNDVFPHALNAANLSLKKCIKFNEFVNEAFPSMYLADQFKTQFIESAFECLTLLLIDGECLDELRNWATCLVSCNELFTNQLKKRAYEQAKAVLKGKVSDTFINFNVSQWQSFLKWCAPSEEEFLQFKNSFCVESVFDIYLFSVIEGQEELRSRLQNIITDCKETETPNYISLDNFLKWHFGSDKAVDDFKMSKILEYGRAAEIEAVISKEYNDPIVIDKLKWFCNCDMNELITFLSSRYRIY